MTIPKTRSWFEFQFLAFAALALLVLVSSGTVLCAQAGAELRRLGVIHPVVKNSDTLRIVAGYVVCQPHAADYSWLATMEFSTKKIIQQGIVIGNTCGKSTASRTPGELLIFVRPLTWWEARKQ